MLSGADVAQIEDVDVAVRLPNPVDTPDSLFDLGRVPRKVIVHKQVGRLQIQPFCRGVRAKQHVDFPVEEASLDVVAIRPAHDAGRPFHVPASRPGIDANAHPRVGCSQAMLKVL